jgi:hypothetical protein
MFWRVVSSGFDLLSLLLSDGHLYSNPLGLAVHNDFHAVLLLGRCHGNSLGLGVLGLGGDDLGFSGGGVQRSASTAAPRTCPWSCSVMIVVQILRVANLLELCTCSHLVSNFLLNILPTLMRILCLMMGEHVLMGDHVLIVSLDTVF